MGDGRQQSLSYFFVKKERTDKNIENNYMLLQAVSYKQQTSDRQRDSVAIVSATPPCTRPCALVHQKNRYSNGEKGEISMGVVPCLTLGVLTN
mmetsp:Transcript_47684/g.123641  ORF Transcript_47684/g.123641 Transcript_47684/m.123641 type:complete len:93 (+) Transcript_47684:83-361(+)